MKLFKRTAVAFVAVAVLAAVPALASAHPSTRSQIVKLERKLKVEGLQIKALKHGNKNGHWRKAIAKLNAEIASLVKQLAADSVKASAPGATGPQGAAGVNGINGATGPQGPAGVNGTNGVAGVNGENGATGPAGATGATGTQGPAGLTGAPGATGATGPAGPQGSPGTVPTTIRITVATAAQCPFGGIVESTVVNGEVTNTTPICSGVPGATGPQGPPGSQGSPGQNGQPCSCKTDNGKGNDGCNSGNDGPKGESHDS